MLFNSKVFFLLTSIKKIAFWFSWITLLKLNYSGKILRLCCLISSYTSGIKENVFKATYWDFCDSRFRFIVMWFIFFNKDYHYRTVEKYGFVIATLISVFIIHTISVNIPERHRICTENANKSQVFPKNIMSCKNSLALIFQLLAQ